MGPRGRSVIPGQATGLLCILLAGMLVGCSGVEIHSLGHEQVRKASECTIVGCADALSGYVVYQPMVVVSVTLKQVCPEGGDDCKDADKVNLCEIGQPFEMPDYSRPFLVDVRSGLGHAGVELSFADGWRLESVTDNSDNTAVLQAFESLFDKSTNANVYQNNGAPTPPCEQGLYSLVMNTNLEFEMKKIDFDPPF